MDETTQPIICGTDFSENATEAARVAAALAARLDKPLLLVHVAEQCESRFTVQEHQREVCAPMENQLREEAERLRSSGATVEPIVLTNGWAEDAMVRLTRERRPALVVVSSVSKTAFDHWTIGSVSERIAERAPAPTLVARTAESIIAWAEGRQPLRVFVASDFSATADAALHWADELRKIGPCEITAGHIYWPPDECKRFGFEQSTSLTDTPPELHAAVERELTDRITDQLGHSETKIIVQANWGRPDAPLIQMAKGVHADLLVVGTHQRHGLRRVWQTSSSRGVLHHAPMSVAVVPATAESRHVGAIPAVQRVLVSTDFSEAGDRAIPHAYGLLPQGGLVRLIHIVPPGELQNDDEERLRSLIPPGAEARGVQTEVGTIEARHVGQAISEEAERFAADVVCIGSHGRSGIVKTLLGSVAHDVMKRCSRPLLVVRARED
jgi:nucleotide-binding universal stress UspA family protein